MKLQSFKNLNFEFSLVFSNGEMFVVNLKALLEGYISEADLASARLDSDWGCLEFLNGTVDIDPTILYCYAVNHGTYVGHSEARPALAE